MFTFTGGFVLVAALLHASWNAMLHGQRDRFFSMTWMCIATASVATLVVLFVPWPVEAAWPYIIASGGVHLLYNLSLVRAYGISDLAQAYPIARGSSPLFVTLGAALFAHEALVLLQGLGIALISGGIIALAIQGHNVSRSGALAALMTGVTIALYTVLDGIGVRLSSGQVLTYTAWMFVFNWLMPLVFIARRGSQAFWAYGKKGPREISMSAFGGLVSVAAYGIVIWALQSSAMGTVSALRETSVVFAALIGRLFLREAVSAKRWLACMIVAAGAVCLAV